MLSLQDHTTERIILYCQRGPRCDYLVYLASNYYACAAKLACGNCVLHHGKLFVSVEVL